MGLRLRVEVVCELVFRIQSLGCLWVGLRLYGRFKPWEKSSKGRFFEFSEV